MSQSARGWLKEVAKLIIYRIFVTVEAFRNQLEAHGGMNKPWVLKKMDLNNGLGIEVMGPNSQALKTAVARADADESNAYIVQAYICKELVWLQQQKFDFRMYWMVASVDPLIVLYHDGFVRVRDAAYNGTDFSTFGPASGTSKLGHQGRLV
jgi:hypothetical protein